jgi:hypothetical protein
VSHESSDDETNIKEQTVKLFNPSRYPIILIQTDKSIYNVGDELKFRVLVLTQNLTPFDYTTASIVIKDSNSDTIKKFDNELDSKVGVFTNSLKIATRSNLGTWKIEVEVDGSRKSKEFNVQKADDVQIDLKTDEVVAYSKRIVEMKLNIRKSNGIKYSGIAKVNAIGWQVGKNRELFKKYVKSVNVTSGENIITVDLAYEMNLNTPNTDIEMKFLVDVKDNKSKKSSNTSANVLLKHADSRIFEIIKAKHFRPGFEFPVKIIVKNFDGTLDQTYEDMTITLTYYRDDNSQLNSKVLREKVYDGKVNLNLATYKDAKEIKMKLQYQQTLRTENIIAVPSKHEEYIQLTTNDTK